MKTFNQFPACFHACVNINETIKNKHLIHCRCRFQKDISFLFEPTLWKFAGTALSGGGGVVEAKVCLAVGGVVALDDVHIYFMVVQT